jgi:nicotinamide-nucleotide amidase
MHTLLPLAHLVGDLLIQRRETVAVAESSSGGMIATSLLAVPGASAYFLGGAVVYTARARRLLMAIDDAEMVGMRSSSEPYAALLARRSRDRFGSTWGLAETGASGPTGNRYGDAAGHTCIAVAGPGPDGAAQAFTLETGHGDREDNMRAFAYAALKALHTALSR